MDVDSEDDQMMQAIALSLGQNLSSLESAVILVLLWVLLWAKCTQKNEKCIDIDVALWLGILLVTWMKCGRDGWIMMPLGIWVA